MSSSQRQIATLLLLATFIMGHISVRENLSTNPTETMFEQRDRYGLPDAELLRIGVLNYNTLAASLTWIAGLLYFGEWRMSPHNGAPRHLENYARTTRDLDPSFFHIHTWLDATLINSKMETGTLEHQTIMAVHAFLMEGREYFPKRYELPYRAGLNMLGYSPSHTKEERIEQLEAGVESLEQCTRLLDCPPAITLTIWMMRIRIEEIRGNKPFKGTPTLSSQEIEIYTQSYLRESDPKMKSYLERALRKNAPQRLEQLRRKRATISRAYDSKANYLSQDVWALMYAYQTQNNDRSEDD